MRINFLDVKEERARMLFELDADKKSHDENGILEKDRMTLRIQELRTKLIKLEIRSIELERENRKLKKELQCAKNLKKS